MHDPDGTPQKPASFFMQGTLHRKLRTGQFLRTIHDLAVFKPPLDANATCTFCGQGLLFLS